MKIMAIDYGDARTGIALCDKGEMMASPIGVIHQKSPQKLLTELAQAAKTNEAQMLVVGNPVNMNGSEGARSQLCKELAQSLEELTGLPVSLWDERSTTVSATYYLNQTDTRGKKRKNVVDAVAAVIILESYLAYRKNHQQG